jgi:glucose-1-phosphate adenylyltransferase
MVASGCIISGGTIHRSILFPRVRINSYSHVEECVLMDGVDVGRYARLRRVIVDRGVQIPPRTEIGFDPEEDRKRFHVSEGGVVVIPKGAQVSGPDE